jgi:hypothetical protein
VADYDESIAKRLIDSESWEESPLAADPSRHSELFKLLTRTLFAPDPENGREQRFSHLEVIGAFAEILFRMTPYYPDHKAHPDGVSVGQQASIAFVHLESTQGFYPPQHVLFLVTYMAWLHQRMAAEEQAG